MVNKTMIYFKNPFAEVSMETYQSKYGAHPGIIITNWLLGEDDKILDVDPEDLAFVCFDQVSGRVFSDHGKKVREAWDKRYPEMSLQLPSVEDVIRASLEEHKYDSLCETLKACEFPNQTLYKILSEMYAEPEVCCIGDVCHICPVGDGCSTPEDS